MTEFEKELLATLVELVTTIKRTGEEQRAELEEINRTVYELLDKSR